MTSSAQLLYEYKDAVKGSKKLEMDLSSIISEFQN